MAGPHAIPVAPALTLPEAGLPVAPRLLGLWLGEGDARETTCVRGPSLVHEFADHGYRISPSGRYRYTIAAGSLTRRHPQPCVACGAMIQPGRQRRWYCASCCAAGVPRRRRPLSPRSCKCGARINRGSWGDDVAAARTPAA